MSANKRKEGRWVHSRNMEIQTLDLGDHRILVEGKLKDTRISQSPSGAPAQDPAVVHSLIARLWVQGPDLTITAAEAEMPTIPREMCPQALPAVQGLVGLRVITGFKQKVKNLIGDVKGCSHLTQLFLTLGPAAVQGYFAAYGRASANPLDHPALSRVIDSCHLWRKDGPYVKSLIAARAKKRP